MGVVSEVRNRVWGEKILRETLEKRRFDVSRRKSRFGGVARSGKSVDGRTESVLRGRCSGRISRRELDDYHGTSQLWRERRSRRIWYGFSEDARGENRRRGGVWFRSEQYDWRNAAKERADDEGLGNVLGGESIVAAVENESG